MIPSAAVNGASWGALLRQGFQRKMQSDQGARCRSLGTSASTTGATARRDEGVAVRAASGAKFRRVWQGDRRGGVSREVGERAAFAHETVAESRHTGHIARSVRITEVKCSGPIDAAPCMTASTGKTAPDPCRYSSRLGFLWRKAAGSRRAAGVRDLGIIESASSHDAPAVRAVAGARCAPAHRQVLSVGPRGCFEKYIGDAKG